MARSKDAAPEGSATNIGERPAVPVAMRRVSEAARRLPLPQYETEGSAGLDLRAAIDESIRLEPGASRLVATGIAIALPGPHLVGLVYARSGLASKHGIRLANGVGVIDSDYRGEILCPLYNDGLEAFIIEPGDRIAQLVITPVVRAVWQEVDALPATGRGEGGFGSTGNRD